MRLFQASTVVTRATFIHHDDKWESTLEHYATLKVLNIGTLIAHMEYIRAYTKYYKYIHIYTNIDIYRERERSAIVPLWHQWSVSNALPTEQ